MMEEATKHFLDPGSSPGFAIVTPELSTCLSEFQFHFLKVEHTHGSPLECCENQNVLMYWKTLFEPLSS